MQMSYPVGQRLLAIRALRAEFGWGLRQAKDFMEYGIKLVIGVDLQRLGELQNRIILAMNREGLPTPAFRYVAQKPKEYGGEPVGFMHAIAHDYEVECKN
jgi:hypothetical protein